MIMIPWETYVNLDVFIEVFRDLIFFRLFRFLVQVMTE